MNRLFAPCPIEGCTRKPGVGKLMCGPHWGAVPPDLQRAVYAALRVYRAGRGADRFDALRAAQAAAIESV